MCQKHDVIRDIRITGYPISSEIDQILNLRKPLFQKFALKYLNYYRVSKIENQNEVGLHNQSQDNMANSPAAMAIVAVVNPAGLIRFAALGTLLGALPFPELSPILSVVTRKFPILSKGKRGKKRRTYRNPLNSKDQSAICRLPFIAGPVTTTVMFMSLVLLGKWPIE